jgi:hypothetical protein
VGVDINVLVGEDENMAMFSGVGGGGGGKDSILGMGVGSSEVNLQRVFFA